MIRYPQVLVNVRVTAEGKKKYSEDEEIRKKIEAVEQELGEDGRILVRLSGTEPLVRVMLEGLDEAQINRLANETADVIRDRIG